MRKSSSPLLTFLALLGILIFCLVSAALAASLYYLPQLAEQTFGPPSPKLSLQDRLYLSAKLLAWQEELTRPLDPQGAPREFRIEAGEATMAVIERLHAQGLIASVDGFRAFVLYAGMDTSLQSGEHSLSPAMTPIEIAQKLQRASPTHVTFVILPGWRMEEIAASLPTSGLAITPQEFLAAAAQGDRLAGYTPTPPGASNEGFLAPGEYDLRRDATADQVIAAFITRTFQNLNDELLHALQAQDLSLYQAITLASIVERESIQKDEMPLIASVYLNRLATGMKLDADPTVQYALGYNKKQKTWWTNPLSAEDLGFDSPYNTYLYPGLPPGPIANPSLQALQAVAFPVQSDYFYFRSGCDGQGRHSFARTFEEHLQNACP